MSGRGRQWGRETPGQRDRRDAEIERLEGEIERLREREWAARAEAEDARRHFSELSAVSKRFASSMRAGVTERREYRRRLGAQLAVSRVLAEAQDLEEAAPRIFEVLSERLGWEVGTLWTVEREALRLAGIWRHAGGPVGALEGASRTVTFRRGEGLPGRVWERREPVWVENIFEDDDFTRKAAAAEDGLCGALAFPVRDGVLVGVFELFRAESLPPDEGLMRTAALIGEQAGQFVERRRAEEAVRRSQERAVFRTTLEDMLRSLTDPTEIKAEASRALGRHLKASRVTYGEGSPDGEVVNDPDYLDGVVRVAGRVPLDDCGSALMGHFRAGRTVVVADVLNDPTLTAEQRAAFEAAQIRAHVSVPLVKGGRLVGALSVTQATARAWTSDEVALVEETAERAWAAVEHARAEEALRESEERYRTLFGSIDEGFCVVEMIFDENDSPIDYRFLEVSPSFEKQTGLVNAQGKRMRELAPQHEEHWFEVYGEIALTGVPARFENRAEQLHRWYDVYAFRFGAPANRQVAILFNDVTERKRTEARLRDSEERYRSLVTATSSIVWTAAPTGECVEEMPSWEEFTGQTFEQYRGFGWLDAVHPDDRPPPDAWERLGPDDTPMEVEYRLRRRDGEYRRVFSRGVPVFGADGGVREWVGTMLDVEERRRAEEEREELRREAEEERARLEAILRQMPGGVFIADLSGRITLANEGAKRIYGKTMRSIEECREHSLSFPGGAKIPREDYPLVRALEGESVTDMEHYVLREDGTRAVVRVNAAPVRDEEGNVVAAIKALDNVTAQKEAEAALGESEERLRTVVEGTPVVLFSLDREGVYKLAEGRGLEALGLEPDEVVGRSIFELFADEPEVVATALRALAGETVAENVRIRGLIFETWYSPMRDEGGATSGVIGVATDVTERKLAEEALDRSRVAELAALAEVDEAQERLAFYAGAREERKMISRELHDRVAHSMAVVRQCLELYEAFRDRDPPAAAAKLEQAKEEAKSALGATRDLSMMLRRSEAEGGLEKALSDLLETTIPADVRYKVSVEGDESLVPPHVGNQLFLILREAIRNAVTHSGCERVTVGLVVAPEGVAGTVEDDGLGFGNGNGEVGGVGMRAMKERAALLGGALSVSSTPDAGTKVEVSVPITEEDAR